MDGRLGLWKKDAVHMKTSGLTFLAKKSMQARATKRSKPTSTAKEASRDSLALHIGEAGMVQGSQSFRHSQVPLAYYAGQLQENSCRDLGTPVQ